MGTTQYKQTGYLERTIIKIHSTMNKSFHSDTQMARINNTNLPQAHFWNLCLPVRPNYYDITLWYLQFVAMRVSFIAVYNTSISKSIMINRTFIWNVPFSQHDLYHLWLYDSTLSFEVDLWFNFISNWTPNLPRVIGNLIKCGCFNASQDLVYI